MPGFIANRPMSVAVCIDTRDGQGRKRLHGVSRFARGRGWRMMLIRRAGRDAAEEVARLRPAGVIAYVADAALVAIARRQRIPLVDTAMAEGGAAVFVSLDNDGIARLAAEHFLGLGLRHFAYCGVRGRSASEERRERLGCRLAAHGLILHAFAQNISEGEVRMGPLVRWLRGLPRPVGILAFDDQLGERVLAACQHAGLRVPDEVAVLGIGDDELICDVSWPSLSSITSPTSQIGMEAARMLELLMLRKPLAQTALRIPPSGIAARESTNMLAIGDTLVKAAARYIRENAGRPIGVKHVARALRVSRRTLDRRFLKSLGRTPHDELEAVRMQRARSQLFNSARSVALIAAECGYASGASFSRAFRRRMGQWPTQFRAGTRTS